MPLTSQYIENSVEQLSSLPGIGKRTAMRLVLNILRRSDDEVERFAQSFIEMKRKVCYCSNCGNVSDTELCIICADTTRSGEIVCVVEDIRDVIAIESTRSYNGIYHVLGGIISPMDGIAPSDLNIEALVKKVKQKKIKEIILALSATMEGDTTCYFIHKKIKDFPVEITTLSRGVAIGTELQYADELTLARSILYRQPFQLQQ